MAYPVLAPNSTWYKSSTARSTITQINIVDSYTPTGSENESWNADVGNTGVIKCYRTGTVLTIAGNGSGKIAMNADSSYLFSYAITSTSQTDKLFISCSAINGLDLFDTSYVTTLKQVFGYCSSLTEIDLSSWDVSKVTTLRFAFGGNQSIRTMSLRLLNISGWNVTNACTSLRAMFQCCPNLVTVDVSSWDTSNVTDMQSMFHTCTSLTHIDVSNWDVSSVENMSFVFNNCASLSALNVSKWKMNSATTMQQMFYGCQSLTSLDTSNWDVSSVTNMYRMFCGCQSLTSLDVSNWDVSKVTTFSGMFTCGNSYGEIPMKIQKLDTSKWNPSSATDMSFMFYGCKGPKTLDVSNWNVSKVTSFDHMFAHSYLVVNGTGNWVTTAATNMNCMFHSLQNKVIDVSKFDTKNVQFFDQMFQTCAATKIVGLENFVTSNGLGFDEMFLNCTNIKELDLSSFNTTKAKDGVSASTNGHLTATLMAMFTNMPSLEKIAVGANFSFNGDGTTTDTGHHGILPTPSSTNIPNANGNWHTVDGKSYAPNAIPNLTAGVYYADSRAGEDYLIKCADLIDFGINIRKQSGTTNKITLNTLKNIVDNSRQYAKYRFNNGTFTSNVGEAIVSDDNHVRVSVNNKATSVCLDLYNVEKNTSFSSLLNYNTEPIFSIPAGSDVKVMLSNVNTTNTENSTYKIRIVDTDGNEAISLINSSMSALKLDDLFNSTSDIDVGAIQLGITWVGSNKAYIFEFDLELYVDGVYYIGFQQNSCNKNITATSDSDGNVVLSINGASVSSNNGNVTIS